MSIDHKEASGWRRVQEDEYFRRRDQALTEQARLRAAQDAEYHRLAEAAGLDDEPTLRELQRQGYSAETLALLYVIPLLEVAWADGTISAPEREVLLGAARTRGIPVGSRADRQLKPWLASPPAPALYEPARRLLRAILQKRSPHMRATLVRELLAACVDIAAASGGVLGFGSVSSREQRIVNRLRDELASTDAHSIDAPPRRA